MLARGRRTETSSNAAAPRLGHRVLALPPSGVRDDWMEILRGRREEARRTAMVVRPKLSPGYRWPYNQARAQWGCPVTESAWCSVHARRSALAFLAHSAHPVALLP
jgi:hypothetical protein